LHGLTARTRDKTTRNRSCGSERVAPRTSGTIWAALVVRRSPPASQNLILLALDDVFHKLQGVDRLLLAAEHPREGLVELCHVPSNRGHRWSHKLRGLSDRQVDAGVGGLAALFPNRGPQVSANPARGLRKGVRSRVACGDKLEELPCQVLVGTLGRNPHGPSADPRRILDAAFFLVRPKAGAKRNLGVQLQPVQEVRSDRKSHRLSRRGE